MIINHYAQLLEKFFFNVSLRVHIIVKVSLYFKNTFFQNNLILDSSSALLPDTETFFEHLSALYFVLYCFTKIILLSRESLVFILILLLVFLIISNNIFIKN